jgi:hypothetical protein
MTTSSKRTGGGLRLVPITPEDPAAEPTAAPGLIMRVPGASGQPHTVIPTPATSSREDQPARFAAVINRFIHLTT